MEWISVKDRYPDDNQRIKIKVNDTEGKEHELECTFSDCEDYRGWKIKPPENVTIYAKPTHWIPIPEITNNVNK